MAPKDGNELEKMLEFAVSHNGPIAIRYPRDGYVLNLCESSNNDMSKAEIVRSGKNVTIVGFGKTVKRALEVADKLKEKSIEAEVINLRVVKPIDEKTVLESIKKTKHVVTIEDGIINGGVASAIQKLIANEKDVKGEYFAYPDEFIRHGKTDEIEKLYGMDTGSIVKKLSTK